jgi:hypothetical protein
MSKSRLYLSEDKYAFSTLSRTWRWISKGRRITLTMVPRTWNRDNLCLNDVGMSGLWSILDRDNLRHLFEEI